MKVATKCYKLLIKVVAKEPHPNNFAWSLIWGIEQHEKDSFFLQWGDNPGFKHFTASSRTKKVGVIVLTNGQNGQRVYRPVVERILGSKLAAFDNI